MKNLPARFAKDESGATAIEYGLIAALVSVAIVAGASALGGTRSTACSTSMDQTGSGDQRRGRRTFASNRETSRLGGARLRSAMIAGLRCSMRLFPGCPGRGRQQLRPNALTHDNSRYCPGEWPSSAETFFLLAPSRWQQAGRSVGASLRRRCGQSSLAPWLASPAAGLAVATETFAAAIALKMNLGWSHLQRLCCRRGDLRRHSGPRGSQILQPHGPCR